MADRLRGASDFTCRSKDKLMAIGLLITIKRILSDQETTSQVTLETQAGSIKISSEYKTSHSASG